MMNSGDDIVNSAPIWSSVHLDWTLPGIEHLAYNLDPTLNVRTQDRCCNFVVFVDNCLRNSSTMVDEINYKKALRNMRKVVLMGLSTEIWVYQIRFLTASLAGLTLYLKDDISDTYEDKDLPEHGDNSLEGWNDSPEDWDDSSGDWDDSLGDWSLPPTCHSN